MSQFKKRRQISALERLEKQLQSGIKPNNQPNGLKEAVPVSDKDITRIKKEIQTLKSRTNG